MAGKWIAYLPPNSDAPRVWKSVHASMLGAPTRKRAIAGLRKDLERQHKAAQEKVAELGRALANLLELEHES